MKSNIYDVIIVGAEPSGAIAGHHLARNGHTVLLFDKCDFPREKICGDGLIADSLHSLARAGVSDEVRQHARVLHSMQIYSPSRICINVTGEVWTVSRSILDDILVRNAVRSGALLRRGYIRHVGYDDNGLFCAEDNEGGIHTARVGILATGVSSIKSDETNVSGEVKNSAIGAVLAIFLGVGKGDNRSGWFV